MTHHVTTGSSRSRLSGGRRELVVRATHARATRDRDSLVRELNQHVITSDAIQNGIITHRKEAHADRHAGAPPEDALQEGSGTSGIGRGGLRVNASLARDIEPSLNEVDRRLGRQAVRHWRLEFPGKPRPFSRAER